MNFRRVTKLGSLVFFSLFVFLFSFLVVKQAHAAFPGNGWVRYTSIVGGNAGCGSNARLKFYVRDKNNNPIPNASATLNGVGATWDGSALDLGCHNLSNPADPSQPAGFHLIAVHSSLPPVEVKYTYVSSVRSAAPGNTVYNTIYYSDAVTVEIDSPTGGTYASSPAFAITATRTTSFFPSDQVSAVYAEVDGNCCFQYIGPWNFGQISNLGVPLGVGTHTIRFLFQGDDLPYPMSTFSQAVTITISAPPTATPAPTASPTPTPPPPTGLSGFCNYATLSLSWSSTANTDYYLIRIDDLATPWDPDGSDPFPGDTVDNNVPGHSYTRVGEPGHTYHWWLHAANNSAGYGQLTDGGNVVCATAPTATPTPTPTPVPICSLSAAPAAVIAGQTTRISWSTSNTGPGTVAKFGTTASPYRVDVSNQLPTGFSDQNPTTTLTYVIELTNTTGATGQCQVTVIVSSPTPAPTAVPTSTPAPSAMGTIAGDPNPCQFQGQFVSCDSNINWSTSQLSAGDAPVVTVSVNGGPEEVFANGVSGDRPVSNVQPGDNYDFALYQNGIGSPKLATIRITGAYQAIGTSQPGVIVTPVGGVTICDFVRLLIRIFTISGLIIGVIVFMAGGLRWITAGGDAKSIAQARSMVTYAGIGLVILLSSVAIIGLIEFFFGVNLLACPV